MAIGKSVALLFSVLVGFGLFGSKASAQTVTDVYAGETLVCAEDGTEVRITFRGKGQPFQVTWVKVAPYRSIPGYSGRPIVQSVSDRLFNRYRGYLVANWNPPAQLRDLVNRARLRDTRELQLPMGQWGGGWASFRILPCR